MAIKTNERNSTNVQNLAIHDDPPPHINSSSDASHFYFHVLNNYISVDQYWAAGRLQQKNVLDTCFFKSSVPVFSSKSGWPWWSGNETMNYIIHPNIRQEFLHKPSYEKMTFPKPVLLLSLGKETAPTLLDPVDGAILHHPLIQQSCLSGPSTCLKTDTAGFSNGMLHKKLDNEKTPIK